MSKIARIYQGLEEIQKYYQGGVLQRLFFDWKHYIGNELNIEYAKECAGRNVVINGKTYQNLINWKDIFSKNIVNDEVVAENVTLASSFIYDVSNYKLNTNYTLIADIKSSNIIFINSPTSMFRLEVYFKDGTADVGFGVLGEITNEYKTFKFTFNFNKEISKFNINIRNNYSAYKLDNNTLCIKNVKILEGDYTHIDLPNSINGIESVGEREFIKSKNLVDTSKITRWSVNPNLSTHLEYPEFIKVKESTTYITNMEMNCVFFYDKDKNKIGESMQPNAGIFTTPSGCTFIKIRTWGNPSSIYPEDYAKFQLEEGTVATPYEPFYKYYPATIRNYNYKCGTDNIILPNGAKNSIETIDGKKVHVQRVWKRVFDGSDDEKWRNGYGNGDGKNNRFEMEISSNGSYSNTYMNLNIVASVCSHFKYEITNSIPKSFGHYRISFNNSLGKIFLLFNPSTNIVPLENVSAWKAWLSENPITVWYELATPLYTYLESGLYDEITIPTSGIKNEIYLENGKWYHKRNIGKVIFDGSSDENWNYYNKGSIQRFDILMSNDAKMYSTRKPVYAVGYQFEASKNEDKIIFISGVETVNKLYIYNYAYTSVKDFRAYLAENPLEVYYELAEPVISELPFSDITYKLNEPLRSLPNGVADTIEGNKLVQRVEKIIFDGSDDEKWANGYASDGKNNRFQLTMPIPIGTRYESKYGYCNLFSVAINNSIPPVGSMRMTYTNQYIYFLFNPSTNIVPLEDLSAWRTWLSKNPTIVYYELATPIETEITPNKILINGEPITDTVGIELPNGTKDIIENDYYVKRVGKVVLDGSDDEKWEIERTTNNNLMNAGILIESVWNKSRDDIESGKIDYYFFSDKLPNQCTGIASTTTEGIMFHMRHMYVRILLSKLSSQDIDGLRNYLSKNPITVWYELATAVKIPLFSIKEGLTTLKSTNNITPQMELDCLVRDDFQNMCDNEWESGDINLGGVNYDNINRIRLVNYIELKPNTIYRLDIINSVPILNSGIIGTRFYDSSKKYLGNDLAGNIKSPTYTFITPADCYYIRFIAETRDTNFKIYLKEVIN